MEKKLKKRKHRLQTYNETKNILSRKWSCIQMLDVPSLILEKALFLHGQSYQTF